jgi:hypothetical protein
MIGCRAGDQFRWVTDHTLLGGLGQRFIFGGSSVMWGKGECRNNVNSPVRTSAIRLLQHLQLLYLPS